MDDQSTAQDALSTKELHELVLLGTDGVTLGIRGKVAQVTDVTLGIFGGTVRLAVGVDCTCQLLHSLINHGRRTVRTSRGAAVGVVTELVNVESTLGVGVVARDVPGDGGGSALGGLVESDGTGDLGVTPENSDCRSQSASVRD